MLVVGDREAADGTVAVRAHGKGDQGAVPLDEFIVKIRDNVAARQHSA
jgi:threonyl-tRNA synthetase